MQISSEGCIPVCGSNVGPDASCWQPCLHCQECPLEGALYKWLAPRCVKDQWSICRYEYKLLLLMLLLHEIKTKSGFTGCPVHQGLERNTLWWTGARRQAHGWVLQWFWWFSGRLFVCRVMVVRLNVWRVVVCALCHMIWYVTVTIKDDYLCNSY